MIAVSVFLTNRIAALLSSMVSITLASCISSGEPSSNDGRQQHADAAASPLIAEGVTILSYGLQTETGTGPSPTFHTAAMTGVLAIENSCMGLRSTAGFTPIVLLDGTYEWDASRSVLTVDGVTFDLGSNLSVAGSFSGGSAIGSPPDLSGTRCGKTVWYVAPGSVRVRTTGQ